MQDKLGKHHPRPEKRIELGKLLFLVGEFPRQHQHLIAGLSVRVDLGLPVGHLLAETADRVFPIAEIQEQAGRHRQGDEVDEKPRPDHLGVRQPLELAEVRVPRREQRPLRLVTFLNQRLHRKKPSD